MKNITGLGCLLACGPAVQACVTCNRQIREAIWDSTFYPNLLTMLSGFIVLGILVILLTALANRRYRARRARFPDRYTLTPVPLITTSMILGIGLGGFIDGITLHQILQWHGMLSNKLAPDNLVHKSVNMFWDGIFHAYTLIVTFIGVLLLWRLLWRPDIDRSGSLLAGGLLMGWGLFNIVEGVIDHHLLELHNVREVTESQPAWNYGFLGISAFMIAIGYALTRFRREAAVRV